MKKSDYILKSLMSATGVFIYVSAVSWLLYNSQNIFGQSTNFIVPLFMLLLFVISAAVTGLLVLGKPTHLYLNGLKKEAIVLLFSTLAWLILFFFVIVVVLLL